MSGIWILDEDPKKAASMLGNQHVARSCRTVTEQLAYIHTCLDMSSVTIKNIEYMRASKWSGWGMLMSGNYQWINGYRQQLLEEYYTRFHIEHEMIMYDAFLNVLPRAIHIGKRMEFPIFVPDKYNTGNVYTSYQLYYAWEFTYLEWPGGLPKWVIEAGKHMVLDVEDEI